MNKNIFISIAVLAVLIITGIQIFKRGGRSDDPKMKGGDLKKLLPVDVIIVSPEILENRISLTGTLLANEETELKNEVAGRITGLWINEGNPVKKGQLLLKINDKELQAQMSRIKLQIKMAGDDLERKTKLFEIKGISQEELDQADNTFKTLNAEADLIDAQIEKTEIRAPFNGVLGLRNVSEGAYIGVSTVITSIQMLNPIKAEFSVPEKYLNQLSINSRVIFTPEGINKKYEAEVYGIEPAIDQNTRTARVRANDGKLIPGGFIKVELLIGKTDSALLIPAEALVPQLNGQSVYVVRNNKARFIPVETGLRSDRSVEIVKGLNPGDTLVVSGILQLKDESGVKVKKIINR